MLCIVQALRADSALSLIQAQHTREVQDLREQVGSGTREHLSQLQTRLMEQQRRTQELEDLLRSQTKQANVQMSLQQVHLHDYQQQNLFFD